jgi:hypothetical protein
MRGIISLFRVTLLLYRAISSTGEFLSALVLNIMSLAEHRLEQR